MEKGEMAGDRKEKGSRSLRALTVIESVIAADRPAAIADIMAASGLPKATVHRLCTLLERRGYLRRDPGGRGLIAGHRLGQMAFAVVSGAGHRTPTHAILRRLARDVGETCNLNVPDGTEMLYIDRVEAEWPLRLQLPVGTRVPLHCTASGKLYLSLLPEQERRAVINNLPLDPHTENTRTKPADLEAELARIRASGVGIDDEEFLLGMTAVAVPIFDATGKVCATIAVHAPTARMNLTKARSHVPAMRRAAAEVAAAFGIEPAAQAPRRVAT
jgi:DNA-binding IclR family transcriptional regulator